MTIASALSLAHKAINTLESPRFRGSLQRDLWKGAAGCEVRFLIQSKVTNSLVAKLARFERHRGCFDDLRGYLDVLAEARGEMLLQREKKGQLRDWRVGNYIAIRDFIYHVSAPYRPRVEFQSHQFELHELLWDLIDLLGTRDALENGTGFKKLDAVFAELVATKPIEFWQLGHPKDLLIIDRLSLIENPNVVCIRTHANYLSTLGLTAEEAKHRDADAIYFNVA